MEYDIGHLICSSKTALPSSLKSISSEDLKNLATECVQEIANKLWELPTERVEGIIVAKLPDPTTRLPREKPCPKAKMETKWSQFAKQKSITKKKKGRLEWSDTLKKWVPRWGYKSEKNEKDWMLEVPQNKNPYEDQFEKKNSIKRERIAKNELQRLRNISRNSKGKVTGISMMPSSKPEGKPELNQKLLAAKQSTASMGDFDKKVKNEEKVKSSVKRKFPENFRNKDTEKANNLDVLAKIKSKKPIVDKDKAANLGKKSDDGKKSKKRKASEDLPMTRSAKKPKTPKKQKGTSKHSIQKKRK